MKKLIAICIAVIMCLSIAGCSNAATPASDPTENTTTESEENTTEPEEVTSEETEQGPIVVENFTTGVIVDQPENNNLQMSITDTVVDDTSMKIYFDYSRTTAGDTGNYIEITDVRINGVKMLADSFVLNNMDEPKITIPTDAFANTGITDWDCLEFHLRTGSSDGSRLEDEYENDVTIFRGSEYDLSDPSLTLDSAAVSLVDTDSAKAYLTCVSLNPYNGTSEKYRMCFFYLENSSDEEAVFEFPSQTTIGDTSVNSKVNSSASSYTLDAHDAAIIEVRFGSDSTFFERLDASAVTLNGTFAGEAFTTVVDMNAQE